MARDPDEIPTGRVRRAAGTSAALGPSSMRLASSLVASVARSPERTQEILEQRHEDLADRALEVLGTMRGGAMKIGQLASFVDVEYLPPEYREIWHEKLAELRDSAPPMSWSKVHKVLEREWDEPVEELFEDFEEDAAAAASIGQVHRAVLPDGRRVAVKVQYPEIADALAADVGTAALLIPLGRALMPGLEPSLIVDELRERILEELDYELEAQSQRAFARRYRGHPFVHVPEVVTDLSRRRVLVSEWVEGAGFREVLELPQADRDRIGEIVNRFYFGSMYRLGRFNTDPHPGNYLVRPDGSVSFLDFGSVKLVDRESLRALVHAIRAGLDDDPVRFVEALGEMGYVHRADQIDGDRLLAQWRTAADWVVADREIRIDPDYAAHLVSAAYYPDAVADAVRMVRAFKVPPEQIWFRRVEIGVVAVLGRLRACANWHRIARELWFGDEPESELGQAEREFFGPPPRL